LDAAEELSTEAPVRLFLDLVYEDARSGGHGSSTCKRQAEPCSRRRNLQLTAPFVGGLFRFGVRRVTSCGIFASQFSSMIQWLR
jgi:hypothetical protein